jgi:hypothetical protein
MRERIWATLNSSEGEVEAGVTVRAHDAICWDVLTLFRERAEKLVKSGKWRDGEAAVSTRQQDRVN